MADKITNVQVDEAVCVGSGDCARIAPRAFRVDEDAGLSMVLDTVDDEDDDRLEAAAYECPTGAIVLRRS